MVSLQVIDVNNFFNKKILYSLIAISIIFALLFSPQVSALEINVLDNYLLGQQVYFEVCDENFAEVNVSVSCLNNSLLESMPWTGGCLMYGFDSSNFTCEDYQITARTGYFSTSKIINILNFKEKLVESLESSKAQDPLNLAIKIYGYSLLNNNDENNVDAINNGANNNYNGDTNNINKTIKELSDALIKLRHNEDKCWPSNKCELDYTVEILHYLSLAGLGKENRVYYDALLWVEYHQNKINNEGWRLNIRSRDSIIEDEEVICKVLLDETLLETITLTENKSVDNYIFDYVSDKDLNVTCNRKFEISLTDYFGDLLINSWAYEDDHISFMMRGGCWSEKVQDWNVHEDQITLIKGRSVDCVPGLTQRILLFNDLSDDVYDEGIFWLKNEIDRAKIAGKQIGVGRGRILWSEDVTANIDAYRVLFGEDEADEIKKQILLTQNNDGSFGEGSRVTDEKFLVTMYAIQTFLDPVNEEWKNYASSWVLKHKNEVGWNNLLLDAEAYSAFGFYEDPIKINPLMPFFSSSKKSFNLFSNSNYDVQTNVLQDEENLKFDIVHNNKESTLEVSKVVDVDGLVTAYLEIFNDDYYSKIPFANYQEPSILFEFDDEYYLLEDEDMIFVPITKSASVFTCDIIFSDFFQNYEGLEIEDQLILPYFSEEDFDGLITVDAICETKDEIVNKTYEFYIRKKDNPPFEVSTKFNSLKKPGSVTIKNNLDELYELDFVWKDATNLYGVPSKLNLSDEKLKVFIYQKLGYENSTQKNTLIVSALGYTQDIDFEILLTEEPFVFDKEFEYSKNYIRMFSLYIFIFLFLTISIALFFLFKGKVSDYFKKREDDKKVVSEKIIEPVENNTKDLEEEKRLKLMELRKLKQKKKKQSMLDVLVAIDKSLSQTNDEIKSELTEEGFKENEIVKAIEDVELLNKSKEQKDSKDSKELKEPKEQLSDNATSSK